MVSQVGADFELGSASIFVDPWLNCVLVSTAPWDAKHIQSMLQKYDKPAPEVRVSYKVIEIYAENDDKIGNDFQAWKNNDGVDLFSAGGRYRRNWSTFFTGGVDNTGLNKTEYYNFNPKWNTRYLDFLTSNGKAKVLTSGTLLVKNREESRITINSGFFYDRTDEDYKNLNADAIERQALTKMVPTGVLSQMDGVESIDPRAENYSRVQGQ